MRAIAVVPIVLFHAGLTLLSGGFIGVDVFFVISGFLITKIISSEIDENTFSIAKFYHRRIVRIVPALLVLSLAVIFIGAFTLLPDEMINLSRSIVATAAFASNLYFWKEADYFAPSSETAPMLHTWSLGVEE